MTDAPLTPQDTQWLQRALDLAEQGSTTTTPNPRVGCVLLKDGAVCGEGWHRRRGEAHAEAQALTHAGAAARGSTAYISLEPCTHYGRTPPCADALVAAGVRRVVAAMPDPNPQVCGGGFATMRAAGVEVHIAAPGSAVRTRAEQLNLGFASRMRRRRPWLRLKIAATLDGKTALESGLSRWISGEEARQDAHHLRACACAVLTGIGTALQDDPQLTVRHVAAERQPLRVLVDSHRRATAGMKLFADDNILIAAAVPQAEGAAEIAPTLTLPMASAESKVDLPALMHALAEREINEVLVEAGRQLNGALLADNLVDEIILYLAARVFGSGKDMFQIPTPPTPQDAPAFHLHGVSSFANGDIKITYQRAQSLQECTTPTATPAA